MQVGRRGRGVIAMSVCASCALLALTGTALGTTRADLVGRFSAGAHRLALGEKSTYAFHITNTSKTNPVANVDVAIHVPKELRYVSHLNGNTCTYDTKDYGDRVVHCFLTGQGGGGALRPGHSLTFKLVLKAVKRGRARCTDADWTGIYPGPDKCLWGYTGDSSPEDPNLGNNHDQYAVRARR